MVRYLFVFTSHFNFLACCREACYGSFVSIIYFVSRWSGFFDAASPSHLRFLQFLFWCVSVVCNNYLVLLDVFVFDFSSNFFRSVVLALLIPSGTRKTILFEQLACAAVDPRGTRPLNMTDFRFQKGHRAHVNVRGGKRPRFFCWCGASCSC